MAESVSLHPITEAIDKVIGSLRALGDLDAQRDRERRELMELLKQTKKTLELFCKAGSYFPEWQR